MSIDWTRRKTAAARGAEATAAIAAEVRRRRDSDLGASDYTQLADYAGNKSVWAAYRQGLRNLPQQAGFPHVVTWPVKPE